MSVEKFDSRAEDLVLELLKIQGHHYVMKADSSTNPDWDIIEFVEGTDGRYSTVKYQVKGHNWDESTSHTIQADFSSLIKNRTVDFLVIVIIKKEENPEIYKFDVGKDISEKSTSKDLFDGDRIQFSKKDPPRKGSTITLNTFYQNKYKDQREKYRFLLK